MITIAPEGSINLCKTPLEADYKNQLTFSSATEQLNYFLSTSQYALTDYTYIRKDNQIKVNKSIDDIIDCNYLFYRNTTYTTRTYYCFITNMEYINPNTTLITFQTDVFQTYKWDIVMKPCFVEREHVDDDTINHNTIDEGLELGDYINAEASTTVLNDPTDFWICAMVSELPDESIPAYSNHRNYNGIFGGLYYLIFPSASDCETAIKIYDKYSKGDAIKNLFMIPNDLSCITPSGTMQWTDMVDGQSVSCYVIYPVAVSKAELYKTVSVHTPDHVGSSYIPKNNKLYTFPYSYIECNNNSGNSAIYRYEDFIDPHNIRFDIYSCMTPGMSMKAVPKHYKGLPSNYNYSIGLGKLPVCAWSNDYYLNWLRQNGLNTTIQQLGGVITTAIGIGTSNPLIALGGIYAIFNANKKVTNAELTPNQSNGNINCGDINFSYENDGGLTFYKKTIRNEMARVIDNYFSMFGYKVNVVKIPNISGRTNWNFVKTIDCNCEGNIPQDDLKTIRSAFNNGITFWHDPSKIYDYSQNNAII